MLLDLLQLADSALPVGGLSHSFGLESLVELGFANPRNLEQFLAEWLREAGVLEAWYCAQAVVRPDDFARLSRALAARKPARESREGSAAMGRRLLDLAARAWGIAKPSADSPQYACCFGYVAGALVGHPRSLEDFGRVVEQTVDGFLHQAVSAQISAAQRLQPLGHTDAQAIRFRLRGAIESAAAQAIAGECAPQAFTPLLEVAQMIHPRQTTRLFVS